MEKRAIYAGSFDPVTLGHIDIIERSAKVFDTVIIGVLINSKKKYLFTVEERIDMIRKELQERNIQNVEIVYYEGLLVNMCKEYNAQTIIRGLRAVTDFEYELQIAYVNKAQAPEIDTMFFTTNLQYAYVSSSTAKELASYHGDVSKLVGEYTAQKLKEKFQQGGFLMKTKVYYCSKCGEKTVHEFVDKKTVGDGTGICRGLLAVMSLGMSETVGADYYYQCRRCGKLKKTS